SAEFTIGEGELMAHDVPLGCAPDEYDDLISGTCSHLPKLTGVSDIIDQQIYIAFVCVQQQLNQRVITLDIYLTHENTSAIFVTKIF
ncbi:hypothetical protein, partial [Citrobacter freundii]